MQYSNTNGSDKTVMIGDAIVAPDGQGGAIVGYVAQVYERDQSFIVRGFGPRIKASTAILAEDALKAVTAQKDQNVAQIAP